MDISIKGIPTLQIHARSIVGLHILIRMHLVYVIHSLELSLDDWDLVRETVDGHFVTAMVLMGGTLDSLVILDASANAIVRDRSDGVFDENSPGVKTARSSAFWRTAFSQIENEQLRNNINSLRSANPNNKHLEIGIWTLINFYKHHFSSLPLPTVFSQPDVCDFALQLEDTDTSGPILYDIVVPAFNMFEKLVDAASQKYMCAELSLKPLRAVRARPIPPLRTRVSIV